MMHRTLLLAALLAGCASGPPADGTPLPVGGFRPEDRVVLGDFSMVQAIAASQDRVYVVYRSAVGIWDPLARRWDVPRTAPNPAALATVFAATVDPLDRSLWMIDRLGMIQFDPLLDRWERRSVPGTPLALALDRADPASPLWVRTTQGWFHVPRIGSVRGGAPPNSVQPVPTLDDAYRDMPGLQSFALTTATGPGLDPGRLNAAAPDPMGGGWYIGTSRRGAFLVDRGGLRPTPLTLGLPGETVGAVLAVPGGAWVTTDDDLQRAPASLAFVPADLSSTQVIEGDRVFGLGIDAARRIVAGDRMLWLATNTGVLAVGVDDGAVRRWSESDGLVDQRVVSLVPWLDGMMAGTMRGVAFIDRVGEVHRPLPGLVQPVLSLLVRHDTLWIGTDRGLVAHVDGSPEPIALPSWDRVARGRPPVLGIGTVADTLVVMTDSDVMWRDPATAAWQLGPLVSGTTGPLRAFHSTGRGVWAGGDRGMVFVVPGGGVRRTLRVGPDLPDAITAISGDDAYLWVGTLHGLVRLRLSPQ
jgi:hypothetical protein